LKLNIKKISIFTGILLIIGIFIIFELFKYNQNLKNYFINSEKVLNNLDSLKKEEYKLNYLVLKSNFYLYENNDLLTSEINKINKIIINMKNNTFFMNNFPNTYNKFLKYGKLYEIKKNNIYRFLTYNSIIKNATIYLDKVLESSVIVFANNKQFLQKETFAIGNVLITKNSFDKSFLNNLNIDYFKKIHFKSNKKKRFKTILVENLFLFKKFFPTYSLYLKNIQNSKSLKYLEFIYKTYYLEKNKNTKQLNFVFNFIIFMLLGGILIVTFLIYLINREHFYLQKSFVTDNLTNLGNRIKFNLDIKRYKHPVLYLINIDKFKHINDIYGSEIGDKILKQVAKILKNKFGCDNKNIYRLGADDFGILCEGELNYQKIIQYFESNPIVIGDKEFNIRISIGISDESPLIETADMALKNAKQNYRIQFLKYNKNSNLKQKYEENIKKSKILQNAVKKDLIIPVFQPIFDNKSLEISKYEVLARIKTQNGLVSIFPYLKIAKENKIYKEITKSIYLKAYDVFKDNNKQFSLNLSIDDLLEKETLELIDKLFENKNFAKRCTFELLESEAIEDYEIVKNFITKMKKLGVKFAIDDFGSGYSNFEHILNLEIDYLKIDGSLIKKIEDNNTKIIVETINSFAKRMLIHTISEFVSTKEILKEVKNLNIDYTQGFYLSKPLEKI